MHHRMQTSYEYEMHSGVIQFLQFRPQQIFRFLLDDSLQAGWSRERNLAGREIYCARPDRPRGPTSFLYNGYRVTLLVVKRPGHGADQPPLSSAEVANTSHVCLHRYVMGWPLTLPLELTPNTMIVL